MCPHLWITSLLFDLCDFINESKSYNALNFSWPETMRLKNLIVFPCVTWAVAFTSACCREKHLRIKRLLAFAGTLLEVRKCQGRGSPDYKPCKSMKLEMSRRFKWMVKYSCKLNWWWKETQHFYVEWKWVCLIPVTFFFWSHCLASICDVRWNLSGFSRYLWKVNSVSGHWIKVREVSRNFNSVGSWHKRICARRSHMPCSSNKEKFNINSTVRKFN